MSETKIPDKDENLREILSEDTVEDLVTIYNEVLNTVNGKTISDIALVFDKLTDWESIERVELDIPFTHSIPRYKIRGARIWYLTQRKGSSYYHGSFFDLQVSTTIKRIVRKNCRLSKAAIEFFSNFPQVKDNKKIISHED